MHIGLVYVFEGITPNIFVKETDKMTGELLGPKELAEKVLNTDGWAPIIYEEYIKKLK